MSYRPCLVALTALAACHMPTESFHGADAGEDAPDGGDLGDAGSDASPVAQCPNMHFTLSSAPAPTTGTRPYAVDAFDVNGDSSRDLVVANSGDGTVSVLLNQRAAPGTFQARKDYETCAEPGMCAAVTPRAVHVANLDVGNWPDIVVVNVNPMSSQGSVGILRNLGSPAGGTFPSNATEYATAGNPQAVAVAKLDGKNHNDLVVTERNVGGKVGVRLNNGDGTFGARVDADTAPGGGPGAVAVADVDGDGMLDVIVAEHDIKKVSVLKGLGGGSLAPSPDVYDLDSQPVAIVVANLTTNPNTRPDIIVATMGLPDPSGAPIAGTVAVLPNNGHGAFSSQPSSMTTYPIGRTPQAMVARDLDGDGVLDLVVANQDDNNVSVLFGNGDGTFQPAKQFPDHPASGLAPQGLVVADVDGDGHLDIVVANSGNNTLSILLGSCGP
jgi:hypothetical protein